MRNDIRRMGDEAVREMQKRGLTVVKLDPAAAAQWHSEAEAAYPKMRGRVVPEDLFNEALRLRKEFRAKRPGR
jgi:hypothetical protein